MSVIYHFSTLNFSLNFIYFVDFRLDFCYLNFIPNLKNIKIYSNKRDVKHLERIFLALEVGKKLRRRHAQKKRGAELSKKRFGLKKMFLG